MIYQGILSEGAKVRLEPEHLFSTSLLVLIAGGRVHRSIRADDEFRYNGRLDSKP